MGSAVLNGEILDDGGLLCEGRFQYGRTSALGTNTPWIGSTLTTGDTFSQLITGLAGNKMYYFRAQARNGAGTSSGSILSFITTGAAHKLDSVDILSPTDITEFSATLNGVVMNSENDVGSVRFHYGLTTEYGMRTGWQHGFATLDLFHAGITGLALESAYHCRAEFGGSPSVFSRDLSFSTLSELGGLTLIDEEILRLLEV